LGLVRRRTSGKMMFCSGIGIRMKSEKGSNVAIIGVAFASIAVVVAAVYAVVKYRSVFGSQLSSISSDWSNFGSYIGGIFSPLISFVTLIAVMLTVVLQKRLLDEQSDQFVRMNQLQKNTFNSQADQIVNAERQAEDGRLTDLLNSLHSFLALKIGNEKANLETFKGNIANLKGSLLEMGPGRRAILENNVKSANALSEKIDALLQLAEELVIRDFSDSYGAKQYFKEAYLDITARFALHP
jgi:hypothetical protein